MGRRALISLASRLAPLEVHGLGTGFAFAEDFEACIDVEPGLTADGFVEVTTAEGPLELGQLVVVGYENPEDLVLQ